MDAQKAGWKFEQDLADIMRALDYEDVRVTTKGGDYGIDIVATQRDAAGKAQSVIVQCKKQEMPVGRPVIQQLAGVKDNKRANVAVVASPSGFTSEARKFAEDQNITLWDGRDIKNMREKARMPEPEEGELGPIDQVLYFWDKYKWFIIIGGVLAVLVVGGGAVLIWSWLDPAGFDKFVQDLFGFILAIAIAIAVLFGGIEQSSKKRSRRKKKKTKKGYEVIERREIITYRKKKKKR